MTQSLCRPARMFAGLSAITFATAFLLLLCVDVRGQAAESPSAPASSPDVPKIGELIELLLKRERVIQNVKTRDFTLTMEVRPPGNAEWQQTPFRIAGTAWHNGLPNSKARVSITQRVMEWQQGPAPWAEVSNDLGFDGQFGRTANHSGGALGKSNPDKTGEVLATAPVLLRDRFQGYADGTLFTLGYIQPARDQSLAKVIQDALGKGVLAEIAQDRVEGEAVVRLTLGDSRAGTDSYWFDPARGYALRKSEQRVHRPDGTWETMSAMQIARLVEAAPGIWYPLKAVREEPLLAKPGHRMRLNYSAADAVINDPAFDERVFVVQFPPFYHIDDRVKGVSYVSGMDPQNLTKVLDQTVDEAEAVAATPARATSSISPPAGAVAATSPRLGHKGILLVVVTAVIAIVAVLGFWMRKRLGGPRRTVVVAAVLVSLSGLRATAGTQQADTASPVQAEVSDPEYRYNCGLNVSYFTARWLGQHPTVNEAAAALNVGRSYTRSVSFADMKRFFTSSGLDVRALKTDRPEELLPYVNGAVVILRLRKNVGGEDVGHFVSLLPADGGVVIADPPSRPERVSQHEFATNHLISRSTGEILVIKAGTAGARAGPAISLPVRTVDLGRIAYDAKDFIGELRYDSVGTLPLKIVEIKLSCSCTHDPTGDKTVRPAAQGVLRFRFDRKKLPSGASERNVLLVTNDPQNREVVVTFKFLIDGEPTPTDVRALPRAIDYGRVTADAVARRPVHVRLIVPTLQSDSPKGPAAAGVDVKVATSTRKLTVVPTELSEDESEGDDGGRGDRVFAYTVSWQAPLPDGAVDEEIVFNVAGARAGAGPIAVRVPVRADFLPQ